MQVVQLNAANCVSTTTTMWALQKTKSTTASKILVLITKESNSHLYAYILSFKTLSLRHICLFHVVTGSQSLTKRYHLEMLLNGAFSSLEHSFTEAKQSNYITPIIKKKALESSAVTVIRYRFLYVVSQSLKLSWISLLCQVTVKLLHAHLTKIRFPLQVLLAFKTVQGNGPH